MTMSDSEKNRSSNARSGEMSDSYTGHCPNHDKILVRKVPEIADMTRTPDVEVRCPSCRDSFHELAQLDWRRR